MKTKKIMLISPGRLPIPATGGGAIEQLITHLINQNEQCDGVHFAVTSIGDEAARASTYDHSTVYYFSDSKCEKLLFPYLRWKLFHLWRHCFKNRIAIKLFPREVYPMDFYTYQCYMIAKKERVEYIVDEAGRASQMIDFVRLVGKDKIFTHIHYSRDEVAAERRIVPNSICISQYVMNCWVKDQSIPGRNCVVYNCVDTSTFKRRLSPEEKNALRKELGINEGTFTVLFCGRISKEKGVRQLVEAFGKLKDQDICLLLIGSVDFSLKTNTEFSKEITSAVKTLPNIKQLGYIPNWDIYKYCNISDLQVIPSICEEGAGLTAVEGMAAGLPLIVTRSGGMVEYVNDKCAVILPINDQLSDNIADSIVDLMNDPARREAMSAAAHEQAELFTPEHYYHDYINAITQE